MTSEIIFIVEESLDGGYEAKALDYSIYTQAESYEEIKELINEVEVWKRAYDQARFANKLQFTKKMRMERIQHLMLGFIYGITVMFFIFIMIFF
jgi:hypothetical protein